MFVFVQGYPAVMASEHLQGTTADAALPMSHLAAAANPMLAGAVAAQQPQQAGTTATLLPLAAAAGAIPGAHPNPSAGHCPAVFVANIGHIGSDRDLKDLFNRFVTLDYELSKIIDVNFRYNHIITAIDFRKTILQMCYFALSHSFELRLNKLN